MKQCSSYICLTLVLLFLRINVADAAITDCNQHIVTLKQKIKQSIVFENNNRTIGLQTALDHLKSNCSDEQVISDIENNLMNYQQEMKQQQDIFNNEETQLSIAIQQDNKSSNDFEQLATKLEKDKMVLLDLQDNIEILKAELEGLRLQYTN